MKKLISVFLIILCCTISLISCENNSLENIDFEKAVPQAMSANINLPEDIVFEIENLNEEMFGNDINIYKGKINLSTAYVNGVLGKFGMNVSDEYNYEIGSSLRYYKKGDEEISITQSDGTFIYRNKDNSKKNAKNEFDKENLDKLGEEKLKELGLLPECYCRDGYTSVNGAESPKSYGPIFAQLIDGKKVYGSGCIGVEMNNDGDIVQLFSFWNDAEYVTTLKSLSFEEICSRIRTDKAWSESNQVQFDKVVYNMINIGYYKNPDYDYYVPIIKFDGTGYYEDKEYDISTAVIAVNSVIDGDIRPE